MGGSSPASAGTWSTTTRPTEEARRPDPARMLSAYQQSASTLNLLRAFTKGGFADLSQVHTWNQQFVADSPGGRQYDSVAGEIDRALRFMQACGVDLGAAALHQVDFWTSHEALILGFEEAMTRRDSLTGRLVRHLRPPALGGRAHPTGRRRPHRVPKGAVEPVGGQDRAGSDPG